MFAMAMKSWGAGEPLAKVELPDPEPRAREVRVAVHAIGVNPVDWKMRSSGPLRLAARVIRTFRGPRGPVILGVDFAGVEQPFDDRGIAVGGGQVERGDVVARGHPGVGAGFQEEVDQLKVVALNGPM